MEEVKEKLLQYLLQKSQAILSSAGCPIDKVSYICTHYRSHLMHVSTIQFLMETILGQQKLFHANLNSYKIKKTFMHPMLNELMVNNFLKI
jgi:hypothetical protein